MAWMDSSEGFSNSVETGTSEEDKEARSLSFLSTISGDEISMVFFSTWEGGGWAMCSYYFVLELEANPFMKSDIK